MESGHGASVLPSAWRVFFHNGVGLHVHLKVAGVRELGEEVSDWRAVIVLKAVNECAALIL